MLPKVESAEKSIFAQEKIKKKRRNNGETKVLSII